MYNTATVEEMKDNLVEYQGANRFGGSKKGHLMIHGCRGEIKEIWGKYLLFRPLGGTHLFPVWGSEVRIV
jgi:hypothetical protein